MVGKIEWKGQWMTGRYLLVGSCHVPCLELPLVDRKYIAGKASTSSTITVMTPILLISG
jgi:hypothetical protein